jgi:hypothetical protein
LASISVRSLTIVFSSFGTGCVDQKGLAPD